MKVLVVEDHQRLAQSIKKGLEQEGFVVDVAFDGDSGLEYAYTGEYDCIVLDWMLPKINGFKACLQLRGDGISTPVLMLTAKGELEDKVSGLNNGADDYLTKPFEFEELVARIKALGRRPKEVEDVVIKVGNLEYNSAKAMVKRDNKSISLSKRELALFEYLLRNRGRVVTKQELVNRVWEFDADVTLNTVEVYIGYLRKKIDKPFKKKDSLIKTVRGFGYKIKDHV